jgi:hypothetical protein
MPEKRRRFAYAYDNLTAVRVEVSEGVGESRDEVTVIDDVILDNLQRCTTSPSQRCIEGWFCSVTRIRVTSQGIRGWRSGASSSPTSSP